VTSAATENVGWTAFDAGRNDVARRWWLEALHAADLAEDTNTRAIVLLSMGLAAHQERRGGEAVDLADAARRAAPDATPLLASLTAARSGLGHGRLGDKAEVVRSFATAQSLLDRGPAENDPPWIGFWGPSDLATHEARAWAAVGDHATAIRAARESVAAADPLMSRNKAIYRLNLAWMLAQHGDVDEAIDNVGPQLLAARKNTSRRVTDLLDRTVHAIGGRGAAGRDFAAWARTVRA
jgi:tetratricopeptide (TPR) repeat protein